MSHKVTLTNYDGKTLTFTADRVVMAPDGDGRLANVQTAESVLFVNPSTFCVLIEPQPAPPTVDEIAKRASEAVLRALKDAAA